MAGILTEAISSIESGRNTDIIIGVGLNFSITDFPEELANKATSLFTSEKPSITRNQLISEIWKLFLTIPTSDLVKVYKEKSLVLDKQVTFEQAGRLILVLPRKLAIRANFSFLLMMVRKNG